MRPAVSDYAKFLNCTNVTKLSSIKEIGKIIILSRIERKFIFLQFPWIISEAAPAKWLMNTISSFIRVTTVFMEPEAEPHNGEGACPPDMTCRFWSSVNVEYRLSTQQMSKQNCTSHCRVLLNVPNVGCMSYRCCYYIVENHCLRMTEGHVLSQSSMKNHSRILIICKIRFYVLIIMDLQ